MSTSIVVLLALAAALTLGISSVADQRSTKRVQTRRALSPWIIVDLMRQPLWLAAIGANIGGFALQVVALNYGSLALVQPILVGDLLFATLISWYLGRGSSSPKHMFGGVLATTVGVAGFLAVGQPSGGHSQVTFGILAPLAIGLVVMVGGCLFVAERSRNLRPLALALACGVCYGTAAFVIKLVTSEFSGGAAQVFTNWPIYVFAVVGPAGFILNQNAFQEGRFLPPVQAIITTADPIISVGLGIAWLGVHLRGGPANVVGEVASLMVMTVGIVVTAYYAPQVSAHARPPTKAGPAGDADLG